MTPTELTRLQGLLDRYMGNQKRIQQILRELHKLHKKERGR